MAYQNENRRVKGVEISKKMIIYRIKTVDLVLLAPLRVYRNEDLVPGFVKFTAPENAGKILNVILERFHQLFEV